MTDSKLQETRARIDAIDQQLQTLINERASCAEAVAEIKRKEDKNAVFYRPDREAQILREIMRRNKGPLSSDEIGRLFREILSACLALEQGVRAAYLGPEGTFTQEAALKHFGHSVRTLPFASIDEVFREVEANGADYGVVPIENSTEGAVNHTLDMFVRSALKICGEVELRVHHHLVSSANDLSTIETVYAHTQALAQCREWLDTNLPNAARIEASSNAEAAKKVVGNTSSAAIASAQAADLYKLNRLISNIEDEPENTTRFLIIGRQTVPATGEDKTSILLSNQNKPGSLYTMLEPLARNDISMTKIESRPSRGALWEYVFFIDVEGHISDSKLRNVFDELEGESALFRVLGSYPRAAR